MSFQEELDKSIRTIPDFPKPGIQFKDITPLLRDPILCKKIVTELCKPYLNSQVEVVAGIESRGFLFGMMMAQELNASFAIIRKKGKLPHRTIEMEYALEYGTAIIEMHEDEIKNGQNVLIHDDLLATGGTALAAAQLVEKVGGNILGFSFLIELSFLEGVKRLNTVSQNVEVLIEY